MGLLNDLFTLRIASEGTCVHTEEGVAFFVYDGGPDEWDRTREDKVSFILGKNVLVRSKEDLTEDVIKHELEHSRQMDRWGGELIFRPLYLLGMLKAKVLTGDSTDNPFEREALDAETR